MQKNWRKILVNFFLFPITLLALVLYIYFSFNPQDLPQPVIAYVEKAKTSEDSTNSFCPENSNLEIAPEFSRAINLAKERLGSDGIFLADLVSCVDIRYYDLNFKTLGDKIEGKFETLDAAPKKDLVRVSIDQSYQQKDDLLLAFVLTHELTHAKQYFNFQKTWELQSCLDREAESFQMEIELFTSLNKNEKESLLKRIKNNDGKDTTLESLRRLIQLATFSAKICQNMPNQKINDCFKENNLASLRKILLQNKTYSAQCGT